jgi:hypothetical protein
LVVFVTVALNCCGLATGTCAVVGDTVMLTAGATVTIALPDDVGVATEVAVTVTWAGLGTVGGAVYKPLDETVPQEAAVQPVPLTLQFTLVFDEPPTVAVNCCVLPSGTSAVPGETLTATA